jgi:hypothetical protein
LPRPINPQHAVLDNVPRRAGFFTTPKVLDALDQILHREWPGQLVVRAGSSNDRST